MSLNTYTCTVDNVSEYTVKTYDAQAAACDATANHVAEWGIHDEENYSVSVVDQEGVETSYTVSVAVEMTYSARKEK